MLMLLSLISLLLQTEMPQRELRLTVTDSFGQPVTTQQVRLQIYLPHRNLECVTDGVGECVFEFSAENPTLRGQLTLVGRGSRSVMWRGQSLALPLQLNEQGLLETPIDFALPDHTQPIATSQPSATTLVVTPSQRPTATATQTLTEPQVTTTPISPTAIPESDVVERFNTGIDTMLFASLSGANLYIALVILTVYFGIISGLVWLGRREDRQSGGSNE